MMRPGVTVYGGPVETKLAEASRVGMSHVEIDLNDDSNDIESLTPQRCISIASMARDLSLSMSVHTPYTLNLCDKVPSLRRASVAFLRECLDVAEVLRATHVTVHPGYYNGPQGPGHVREQARARLVDSVRQTIVGRHDGAPLLALETVGPAGKGSMFSLLGVDTEDFDFLLRTIPSPSVAMCLDIGHTNLCDGGPMEYMRLFAARIVAIHYHDNHGEFDEHLKPGNGSVPWRAVIRALLDLSYGGPFVSEVSRVPAQEAWAALMQFVP